ncbi:hypothetical protein [Kitasatospora sp. NPDC056731]|uniref:hypothetical protein n=1 Tax=Kitasatospora sp. NPDC056731 TaxID=3155422 RepID=UPI0034358FDC
MESILDGTWGSGAAPSEWVDFLLMRRMHWSWAELQETPGYVRRYCADFLGLIAEQEQAERQRAHAAQAHHMTG